MKRRSRRSLERDSKLLAEAVPIMKAALGELEDQQLRLRVVEGENRKLLSILAGTRQQLLDALETIDDLQRELLDTSALLNDAYLDLEYPEL